MGSSLIVPTENMLSEDRSLANHNPIQALNEEDVYIDNYRALGSLYMLFNITKDLNFKTTLEEGFQLYRRTHLLHSRSPLWQ